MDGRTAFVRYDLAVTPFPGENVEVRGYAATVIQALKRPDGQYFFYGPDRDLPDSDRATLGMDGRELDLLRATRQFDEDSVVVLLANDVDSGRVVRE